MTGHDLPFDDLERSLADLAEDIVFPPTPAFTVTHGPGPQSISVRSFPWWKAGLVAAAVLLLAIVAVPSSREAVADWLGVPGIRIEIGDEAPPATVTSIGGSLLLGEAISIETAQGQVAFPVQVPAALAGIPPESYLNDAFGAPVVSLLYPASADLPKIGSTGVGLLLMEIDAGGDTPIWLVKRATGETPLQPVTVNGREGYWIAGGTLLAETGDPFWTYQRRSGNVLVWEEEGITYRMESDLPLAEAIAIAESLEPARP